MYLFDKLYTQTYKLYIKIVELIILALDKVLKKKRIFIKIEFKVW